VKNITISIEDEIYEQSRVIAAQRKKTVTGMVREYLQTLRAIMSRGALVSKIFGQVGLTPGPILRQAVERPSRSVVQYRLVQTVKAIPDAEGQRTFHLPAALLAKFLRRLLFISSHAVRSLLEPPSAIKPSPP
jgi:hypothetical protein